MTYSDYTWISGRLAIGAQVWEPENLPFDAILSMATHASPTLGAWVRSGAVEYVWCPVVDDFCEGAHRHIVESFDEAAAQIDRWQRAGKRVLVHCGGGISRSISAVIWHRMRYRGDTWEEALAEIKARRPIANPDISFELPLRLANGQELDDGWLADHVDTYIASYRAMGRDNRGRDIDAAFVRDALRRQGTIR